MHQGQLAHLCEEISPKKQQFSRLLPLLGRGLPSGAGPTQTEPKGLDIPSLPKTSEVENSNEGKKLQYQKLLPHKNPRLNIDKNGLCKYKNVRGFKAGTH